MPSTNTIGGFLEIDLRQGQIPHPGAILLNSGRSCFEYILRAEAPKKVYIPKYTCSVMLQTLQKVGIAHAFYSIDKQFELAQEIHLNKDEFLVYTNYFGLKDAYSKELGKKYGSQLILDCASAFYFEQLKEGHTFYSPRKFFGLPDGGLLITDVRLAKDLPQDVSFERMQELLRRIDLGAGFDNKAFMEGTVSLEGQPIKKMSNLTRRLMANIDYEAAQKQRLSNFLYLHKQLKSTNRLPLDIKQIVAPMGYPYLPKNSEQVRKRLLDNNVLVSLYWDGIFERFPETDLECYLTENILHLPIEQSYRTEDMQRIIAVIKVSP